MNRQPVASARAQAQAVGKSKVTGAAADADFGRWITWQKALSMRCTVWLVADGSPAADWEAEKRQMQETLHFCRILAPGPQDIIEL